MAKSVDQRLVLKVIKNGHKISPDKVLHIWKLEETRKIPTVEPEIIWIEVGYHIEIEGKGKGVGYKHFLKHEREFRPLGIQPYQFLELVEAATKVGLYVGEQKSEEKEDRPQCRPIFGLRFHGTPLFVAVTVGTNGFVVSMNRSSTERSTMDVSGMDLSDKSLPSWPPSC
jgi:hypothetical protein